MPYNNQSMFRGATFRNLVTVGLGSQLIAVPALWAQNADAAAADSKLERVVVTGSLLSGAEAEGSLAVTPIEMSSPINQGFANLSDVFRLKLPQLAGTGNLNEGFGNGGSGQSFISLRGLPGNATLLLVDGRRTSTSDLNLIPLAAIENIDVLNDGAGAIYGTDAVAGVVNIKLKKKFQGTMFSAFYGNTFDKDAGQRRFHINFGTSTEKTTAFFSGEFNAANDLLSIDRDRSFPSGSNVSGTSNPGLFFSRRNFGSHSVTNSAGEVLSVANGIALRWTPAFANTRGLTNAAQVPTFTGALPATVTVGGRQFPVVVSGNRFDPFAYVDTSSATAASQVTAGRTAAENALTALLPAGSAVRYGGNQSLVPGTNPGFPFGYYTTAYRPHERYGFDTSISHKLFGENLEVFADAYYMRNRSEYTFAPPPLGGQTMSTSNYWWQQVFPGSPAGQNFNITYRPVEAGPRVYFDEFETIHTVAGLKGQIGESSWHWETAFLYDRTQNDSLLTGGILTSDYLAALNSTDPSVAFNPFGYTPIGASSAVNSPGIIDSFKGQAMQKNVYVTQQFDALVGGEVFDLPGGAIQASVGAQTRRDSLDISPDFALQTGGVSPFNTVVKWNALRQTDAAYGEIQVPIFGNDLKFPGMDSLTFGVAARYEEFSDVGDTGVKPRFNFRWQPIEKQLVVRGSYAQGFIAPSLASIYRPAGGQDFPEVFNPITGIRTQPQNGVLAVNNPNLKPEEADNWLIGFKASPNFLKGFTIGLDYYKIQQQGIPFASEQFVVNQWAINGGAGNASNPFGANAVSSGANPTAAQVEIDPTTGDIDQIRNVGPINTGSRVTDGLDLTLTQEFETSVGKFTLTGNATKVLSFTMENFPGSAPIDYLGSFWASGAALADVGFPEYRSTVSFQWEYERYYAALAWNFTSAYQEDQSGQNFETIDGSLPDIREGRDYHTFDLRTRYTIPKVEANLAFGINNLFDETPPAFFSAFESNVDRQYADLRGRFYYLELSKKF
jgi:outer membrane receptor protein involved in Fe transport